MLDNSKALRAIKHSQKEGRSIAFVSGNFNIIHPGHIRFLSFAKEQADILVVGLLDQDSSIGAYFSNEERLEALTMLSFIDQVILIKNDLKDVLLYLKPDVVVKGKEFQSVENPEELALIEFNGKLLFSSGEKQFSSRQLLQQQFRESSHLHVTLQKYHQRYSLNSSALKKFTDDFSSIRVAVFGDIIVDEYQECLPIGMSQEDPTIAVSPMDKFSYLGGAGIVASHAASLGAKTDFYSVSGCDHWADFALNELQKNSVKPFITMDPSRPTTHKKRYRAKDKTLLRVNNYRKHDLSATLAREVIDNFKQNIDRYDLVIFADFNYGILTHQVVNEITSACAENNIAITADSQTSSQIGDLSKYKGLLLTCPTEVEARLTTQDDNSGLIQVSTNLGEMLAAKNVIITLGSEGVLIRHLTNDVWETDRLPAFSDTALDTAGAGDALFVTTSLALTTGASIWQASFLGSVAASIQVHVRGNIPISKSTLLDSLENYIK